MANNTTKFKVGLNLIPQSSDPVNPQEGDVFYSDGTSRAKGLWAYNGSTWVQADSTGGGGATTLSALTDTTISSPVDTQVLTYSGGQWINAAATGGSGEVNTVSNIGTAGVGVFKQKTGVDFEFKKINAGSNKVTIVDDTLDNEIDIDINSANINTADLNNDAGFTTYSTSDFGTDFGNKTTNELPEGTEKFYSEKGTLATLEGLDRKQGKIYYATDVSALYYDDGTELIRIAKDSQRNEEIFTLNATDVSNGYVTLQTEAYANTELVWKNDNNGLKFRGDDFTTQLVGTQTQVDLLAPFSATVGDKVAVNYQSDLFIPSGIRSAVFKPDSSYGVFTQSLGTFSQFAFSAWVYLPSTAVGTQEFVSIGRTTLSNGMLLVQSGSNLIFQVQSKTATISGLAFNDGWYHIGCIFNGQNSPQYNLGIDYGKAYLNGVASGSATGGGGDLITFNNGFTSGIGGVATAWFDGSFANAHIWIDKGLIPSDMASLSAAGYYTDPNAIIGKAPDHGYLFGDLGQAPADDITTIYDRVGTNDVNFNLGGNPARNLDSFSTNAP